MSRLLSIAQVCEKVSLSRSTIYKLRKTGDFPPCAPLGPGYARWLDVVIDQWIYEMHPLHGADAGSAAFQNMGRYLERLGAEGAAHWQMRLFDHQE